MLIYFIEKTVTVEKLCYEKIVLINKSYKNKNFNFNYQHCY